MGNKINIITIDYNKDYEFKNQEEHYLKQIKFWDVSVKNILIKNTSKNASPNTSKNNNTNKEIEKILQIIAEDKESTAHIALDETGEMYSTQNFTKYISKKLINYKKINLYIGGPNGHDESILKKCNDIISLSKMTFTHKIARLILVEQIYRVYNIAHNHPYHKN